MACAGAVLIQGRAAGVELPPKRLEQIAALSFDGVDFSTSKSAFLDEHAAALPTTPFAGERAGVVAFELPGGDVADRIVFAFFEDKLIEFAYVFEAERVARSGGAFKLLSATVPRFGPPTAIADASAHWEFPTIDRTVRTKTADGRWWLRICHSSRWAAIATPKSPNQIVAMQTFALPTAKRSGEVPEAVVEAIRAEARLDFPGEPEDQGFFVQKQLAAYAEVERFQRDGVPEEIVGRLKEQESREHRLDFLTQLDQLKRQTKAYLHLRNYATPAGIAQGTMYRLQERVAYDHPYDYATQLFVIDHRVTEILNRR